VGTQYLQFRGKEGEKGASAFYFPLSQGGKSRERKEGEGEPFTFVYPPSTGEKKVFESGHPPLTKPEGRKASRIHFYARQATKGGEREECRPRSSCFFARCEGGRKENVQPL